MKIVLSMILVSQIAMMPAYAAVPAAGQQTATETAANTTTRQQDLNEIARVATIMIDGDVCQRILTPRALQHMLHPDPRDQWSPGDNYDVNANEFIATKKTLIRLSMMASYPVDVNLWMPVPTTQDIQVLIRNKYNLSQFWNGELQQTMPPEMQEVLKTGQPVTIQKMPGMLSVLTPVRNSLNQIVGLVEVVTSTVPSAHDER